MWGGRCELRNSWVIALLSGFRNPSTLCLYPCAFPVQGVWVGRAWDKLI